MSIDKLKKVLIQFTNDLRMSSINYALGGSLLLYLEGIDTSVNDIDLLVDTKDNDKLQKVLKKYEYRYTNSNPKFKTTHFYTINIDNIDIDIMLGFKILRGEELYIFPFLVNKTISVDNEMINLSSLEEWLKAYTAMNRKDKVELITNYIESKNITST